jgi:hypothetical protein
MYYYFTSPKDCAIKLNGIYLGVITNVIKHVNIISDNSLVEFVPLNSNLPNFSFTLNSEFLSNPPQQVCVTDMKGGFLLVYNPLPSCLPFKVIEQQKFDGCVVTVFTDGTQKISIETQKDFYTENVDFEFDSVNIKIYGDVLVVGFIAKVCFIHAYKLTPKITPILQLNCNEFSFDNQITTTTYHRDIAKHCEINAWCVQNSELKCIDTKITCRQNFSVSNLALKIIPYAFLEELLVGGNVDCYLDTSIKSNADKLRGFFGNFIGLMPPPFFVSPKQLGLIYKKSFNCYYVEYCSFELNGRLISGIKK